MDNDVIKNVVSLGRGQCRNTPLDSKCVFEGAML